MDIQQSPTAPKRVQAAERKQQAVFLRIGGKTYEQIGAELGISKQAAHKLVTDALRDSAEKTAESADELRRLEVERLDFMRSAIWKQVIAGNLGAIDRAIRIGERISKLEGLDAPTKIAPTDPEGDNPYMTMDAAELVKLAEKIANANKPE